MDIKEALIAYAQTDEHLIKVEEAKSIIRSALKQSRKPYVAFSGGKDSTCLLHLVLQEKPDVMVLHWDYGRWYVPRWLEKEIIENARKLGAKNIRVETSEEYERRKRKAINVLGREYLGKLIPQLQKEGYDLVFVGLREEESAKRKRRIRAKRSLSPIPECWAIAKWSWRDVWGYIFSHNLPYASIYDLYAPVVGWDRARLATFFDPEFRHLGKESLDGILLWRFRHPSK